MRRIRDMDLSSLRIIHRDDYLEWRATRDDGQEVGFAWRKSEDLDSSKFWETAISLLVGQVIRELGPVTVA